MILPNFEYKKAQSVDEAIAFYGGLNGKARYLAGGTDLIPLVKLRLQTPESIIDLKGIEQLKTIGERDGGFVIGANATLFDLKKDPVVEENFPALVESLEATACETLQMRGTIGGNILQDTRCLEYNKSLEWRSARGFCYKMGGETCNVVPKAKACFSNYCSDNAPSLISLAARAKLAGPKGERTVELEKIYSGEGRRPFVLEDGELLTEILLPMEKTKGAYEKLRVRNSMDYPLAGVAVSAKGSEARVCVCGIGLAPRLYVLQNMDAKTIQDVSEQASKDAKPVMNTVLSPSYRKKMVAVLVRRALARVQEGR